MQTAPLPSNESERLQALRSLELHDQWEERFDRVTRLAAEIFKAPIAFVSFIERPACGERRTFQWIQTGVPDFTFCARRTTSQFVRRTQPWLVARPMLSGSSVP